MAGEMTTTARVIDGKAFAAGLRARIGDAVPAFAAATGRVPGLAVVLVSTDFEEVASVAHRALVFVQGRMTEELAGDQLTVGGHADAHPAHRPQQPAQ